MKQKLVIVNNGLRDHLGHYFETSVALAEAARRAGLHPVLATHVDCRVDLLPPWLEAYPIFCTDHWMAQPPAEPPDLTGISHDPYHPDGNGPLAGRQSGLSVRQFLAGRLEKFAPVQKPEPAAAVQPGGWSRLVRRGSWACRKALWAADRAAYYLLPPLPYDFARYLAATTRRFCMPRIMVREHRDRVRGRAVQIARRLLKIASCDSIPLAECTPEIRRSLTNSAEQRIVAQSLAELTSLDLQRELEYALIFKRDLERLLALADVGAGDHVLLGTAHAREVLAVQLIGQRLGEARIPDFHLEFRHQLFHGEPAKDELDNSLNVRMQRSFLSLYEEHGPSTRIHFYTDTKELSHDYSLLSSLPFGVLPIPFRSELIDASPPDRSQPLRLAYLGEARDEKGFHWLPDLIDDLMDKYVRTGKARFLLQANVSSPQYNPRSSRMLDKLRRYPREQVELFGLGAPLTPQEYYALVSQADVVLLPYERNRYRACSSGTLAEAIAGGRPAVVPAGSWMSSQIPQGGGETFYDYDSFVDAVGRLIDNYDAYRAEAEAFRSSWMAHHTPDCLISRLIGRERFSAQAPRLAA